MDVAVRMYLVYLLFTFVLDTLLLVYLILWKDNCSIAGDLNTTALFGRAFVCGFLRILSYLFVSVAITVEVYCLFIVWSLCEDVHEGASGPGLWELIEGKEEAFEKKHEEMRGEREGPYANIPGLAYYANLPGAYPSPYNPHNPYGAMGNSSVCRIFGGSGMGEEHEMNFGY